MKLLLIFCFLNFLNLQDCRAQDTASNKTAAISRHNGRWWLNDVRINEKKLKFYLYQFPETGTLYNQSKAKKVTGISLIPPAILFSVLARPGSKDNSPDAGKTKKGWMFASVGTTLLSAWFIGNSYSLLKKAVRIRNTKVLSIY